MTSPYLTLHSSLDKSVKRDRKFFVRNVTGTEALCDDFSFIIRVGSLEKLTPKELEELIGGGITAKIAFKDSKSLEGCRYLNGVVYKINELGMSRAPLFPDVWHYEIEIGSWLRNLGFVSDCRVFQKSGNTRVRIVIDLLNELGFKEVRNNTTGKFPRKDYAVVYNETLLNFIKRMLSDEGVTWYFEHEEKRHTMVLVDETSKLPHLPHQKWGARDNVTNFYRETSHIPIKNWHVSSYDWENPPAKNVQKKVEKKAELTHFQYPGGFVHRGDGEKLAERAKTAIKSNKTVYRGASTVRIFAAGHCFNLKAKALPELDQKLFLLKSLRIEATADSYVNTFDAYQAREPYVPATENNFQRPTIFGSQTATVVGEAGTGKIHTDKKGRVKVRFHWDHHSPDSSSHTSAFIRVAGPCTGSQRGFLFTPRIGEEVTISYEDGNPDKPLITGSVFSNDRKPPKSANSKPYKSYIKTGSESDANYITFNDAPGSENFEINAKKDLNIIVGNDLDIEVEDDILIHVKKVNVVIRKDVKVRAGGSIVNLTLKNINQTAGSNINNMALGGVVNVTGGLITNLAGCTLTNTAIVSVENTSASGIKGTAETLLANTALNAVGNTGPDVKNDAGLAMTNISKGGMINDAKNVKTETLFQKVKIKENSVTETGSFKIKGLMSKIN